MKSEDKQNKRKKSQISKPFSIFFSRSKQTPKNKSYSRENFILSLFFFLILGLAFFGHKINSNLMQINQNQTQCDCKNIEKKDLFCEQIIKKIENRFDLEIPRLRNVIYNQGHLIVSTVNKTINSVLNQTSNGLVTSKKINQPQKQKFATMSEKIKNLSEEFLNQAKWIKHHKIHLDTEQNGFILSRSAQSSSSKRYVAVLGQEVTGSMHFHVKVSFPANIKANFPFGLVEEKKLKTLQKDGLIDKDWKTIQSIMFYGEDSLSMIGRKSLNDCPETEENIRTCFLNVVIQEKRDFRIFNDQKSINLVNKVRLENDKKYFLIFEIPSQNVTFRIYKKSDK